ncbi:adenylate/guanylate cyclase domain-containing protein [Pseudovibrio exalbescens]|uniref:adenylate/guanylate cyclase domain-containing protein n=1 Tax=Pseudovibrio exalbescens TaxID=197461 RepID=UPI002366CE25|nr:adenylate/guanylate cyclase domain-containing protein [Pseudovibrio exalbescens]MDD7910174.1 adenylate/guanylate cyclase domain-containing protein [Pseudovibrio exalbescens]
MTEQETRITHTYPSSVFVMHRKQINEAAFTPLTELDLKRWLLHGANFEEDLLDLYNAFMHRLVGAGFPIIRSTLHMGTLHPQLYAYGWHWNRREGYCDEFKVEEAVLQTDSYRKNPLYRCIEFGEEFHQYLPNQPEDKLSPLMRELRDLGHTEYAALPMQTGGKLHHTVTFSTNQEGGFTKDQFASIRILLDLFALHVGRHAIKRIARNVMNTYLGEAAGQKVLAGNIKRGSGEPINAIIWASDLRGSTDLSDRLENSEMLRVLNRYFECLAGAVIDHGGEVLKYIGDGLLAVFPFDQFDTDSAAAEAALSAANSALQRLETLNNDEEALPGISGWRPLRTGIALHSGEVFFGNIGAPQRLDFTVTGKAVNVTSRVESLTKSLKRPLLVTEPVARLVSYELEGLGPHSVKGVSQPLEIFTPKVPH